MQVRLDVARDTRKLFVRRNAAFRAFALLQNLLRRFLVLPEVRLRSSLFEIGEKTAVAVYVKDSSARAGCVRSVPETGVRSLR
jgi:hypothetical protein